MIKAVLIFLALMLIAFVVQSYIYKATNAPRNYPAGFIGPVRLQDTINGKPAYEYKDGCWISTPRQVPY